MPATAHEVAESEALCADVMVDGRGRNIEDGRPRAARRQPDGQFGLFAAPRTGAHPSHCIIEAPGLERQAGPQAHAGADRIAYHADRLRQPPVAAANDPIELRRQPTWPAPRPPRMHAAPGGHDVGGRIRLHQGLQPAWPRLRIIVEEDSDRLRCRLQARVARSRQAGGTVTFQHRHRHPGEFPARPGRKAGIMVHNQQYLLWPRALVQRRVQRRAGEHPPPFGIGADHDAHTQMIINGSHPRQSTRVSRATGPRCPDRPACRLRPGQRRGDTGAAHPGRR